MDVEENSFLKASTQMRNNDVVSPSVAFDVEEIPSYIPDNVRSAKRQKIRTSTRKRTKTWKLASADVSTSRTSNISKTSTSSKKVKSNTYLPLWDLYHTTPCTDNYKIIHQIQSKIPRYIKAASPSYFKDVYKKQKNEKQQREINISICEFFLFCYERQQIWYRKTRSRTKATANRNPSGNGSDNGNFGGSTKDDDTSNNKLTNDYLLSTKHFTNIYRELDKGTSYFRRHILSLRREFILHMQQLQLKHQQNITQNSTSTNPDTKPHNNHQQDEKKLKNEYYVEILWSSICYRLINRIDTFEKIYKSNIYSNSAHGSWGSGIPKMKECKTFIQTIKEMNRNGKVVFTGAHQNMGLKRYIETCNALQKNNCSALYKIMKHIQMSVATEAAIERGYGYTSNSETSSTYSDSRSVLEECINAIQKVVNIGPFFAWQITCDLLECKVLGDKLDIDWVLLGPGAKVRSF